MVKKKISKEAMVTSIENCIKDLETLEGSDDDNDYSEVENHLVAAKEELEVIIEEAEETEGDEDE